MLGLDVLDRFPLPRLTDVLQRVIIGYPGDR
jgi:hypothetical protein